MAFTPMAFSKSWTNPEDFSTFESEERQVREDQQYLFNEIRDLFNAFLAEIIPANIPFEGSGIEGDNLLDALLNLHQQIEESQAGVVANNSVSSAKLQAKGTLDPVTGESLPGAVATNNIQDAAVTEAKLADSAVTNDKIADSAVTNDKIADATIAAAKLLGDIPSSKLAFAAGCILTAYLADESVTAAKLKKQVKNAQGVITTQAAVPTDAIQDFAVTAPKMADSSVIGRAIANGVITAAKLQSRDPDNPEQTPGAVGTDNIQNEAVTYEKTSGVQKKLSTVTVTLGDGYISWYAEVSDVTASSAIIAGPTEDSRDEWNSCGIRAVDVSAGQIEFAADSAPSEDVEVNVFIFN